MALRLAGHLIIGSATPSEDPVTIGYVWMDTGTSKLKICTSVSPYTWVEVGGTGGASAWGDITGTLSDQIDLQAALDAKQSISEKDQPFGYPGMDGFGLIPLTSFPAIGIDKLTGDPSILFGIDSGGTSQQASVAAPLTLTGVSPAPLVVGLDQTALALTESQITNLVSDLAGKAATTQKLDDFGAPDDNTDLNASTSAHGLMQKYPNNKYQLLRGDGSFANSFSRDSPYGWTWSSFGPVAWAGLELIRGRGTAAAPLRTKSGDLLGYIGAYGYNAVDDVTAATLNSAICADVEFLATAAHTAASRPGKIVFATTPTGAITSLARWTIDQDGALTPTAPAYLNVKLDDLIAPDDNTDLDASTSAHGLLKKLPGGTTTYLRADGSFAAVTATPPVLVGPSNVVSTVEAIAANTYVYVGRQLEITSTGSIEIPATSTLEISH